MSQRERRVQQLVGVGAELGLGPARGTLGGPLRRVVILAGSQYGIPGTELFSSGSRDCSAAVMALLKVKQIGERLFDKNLSDLVRGIRNNKENEAKYIATCLEEIKTELRQQNTAVKANAVAKLTYLQMIGYDISWAGFNIIEVMSSSRFTEKRVGYLAAVQSFHPETEVLMLTTNMIRKDLNSPNMYDAGIALSSLACFMSPDLARDLSGDIMTMLTSTKPYLRKKVSAKYVWHPSNLSP